ncbi:hypothetical protein ACQEVF_17755 [Nonomuraea polychroma]|uniref:hypothetical protein n=1 Tax=Nonomuraea polychroma TaxID=46176 RepID=UPI003D8D2164
MTLRFTIDTCCVIDAAQQEHAWQEVNELVELAQQGVIELWLTAAFDGDQRRAAADKLAVNQHWLEERPIIGRTVNPARLDYSEAQLGEIVLVGEEDDVADQNIQDLLPRVSRGRRRPDEAGAHPKIDDVHHLSSHRVQGNDVFVTRDSDMLDIRDQLLARVGILVETPAEALAQAREHRERLSEGPEGEVS